MASIHKIEDIKVVVDTIGESGFENRVSFKPEVLEEVLTNEGIKAVKPLDVHYILTREGHTVHAHIDIKGAIVTQCSVCLNRIEYPIGISLETDYMPALDDMQGDLEALRQSDEIGYYRKEINLGAFILSEMVLSLPLRYECKDGCKGLCPDCGKNLNEGDCGCTKETDPRLEKLMTIKTKLRRE